MDWELLPVILVMALAILVGLAIRFSVIALLVKFFAKIKQRRSKQK